MNGKSHNQTVTAFNLRFLRASQAFPCVGVLVVIEYALTVVCLWLKITFWRALNADFRFVHGKSWQARTFFQDGVEELMQLWWTHYAEPSFFPNSSIYANAFFQLVVENFQSKACGPAEIWYFVAKVSNLAFTLVIFEELVNRAEGTGLDALVTGV